MLQDNNINTQHHPFPPYYPDNSNAIILGTAPPSRFCKGRPCDWEDGDIRYYYGSHPNRFWCAMKQALEPESRNWLRTRGQCEKFLCSKKMAIADLLLQFEREDERANDEDLHPIVYNLPVLDKIVRNNNQIKYVYFTSDYVRTVFTHMTTIWNGEIVITPHLDEAINWYQIDYYINGVVSKTLKGYVLMSPSRRTGTTLDALINDYRSKLSRRIEEQ